MSRSKGKGSSDTAGIAKHTHRHTHTDTHTHTHTPRDKNVNKSEITERVKKDGRCHSTIYLHELSNHQHESKEQDKIMNI